MASRLSTIPREQLPEDQRRFHDAVAAIRRRPISGPFIVLLNSSPDLAARFAHLGHYFHARGQADESIVSLRVRGFIALIGARALDAPYEWSAWVNWALEAGVPQETVDAIRERRPLRGLSAEEALVRDFCIQLLTDHRVRDATYEAALDHFGVQGLVELIVTLGYFGMIAFPLNAFEMEMTAEQKGLRKPFEPLRVDESSAANPAASAAAPFVRSAAGALRQRLSRIAAQADMPVEHRHYFDRIIRSRGRVCGPFQVLLHSPDIAERVAAVGEPILYDTLLPPSAKALTWLITAREFDCDYEWALSEHAAQKAGIPDALVRTIGRREPLASFSDEQQVLADFCHQLLRGNHHVRDATYRAAVAKFGVPGTVRVAATIGYFAMHAMVLNAFEVNPKDEKVEPLL